MQRKLEIVMLCVIEIFSTHVKNIFSEIIQRSRRRNVTREVFLRMPMRRDRRTGILFFYV